MPNEFDDDLFLFPQYGAAICRPNPPFAITHTNLWFFRPDRDSAEFDKGFRIDGAIDPAIAADIRAVVQDRWDCFYEDGARNSILGFEFAIDTGASAPVCCPKPHDGLHESKIILDHIQSLLHNDWIEECGGAWGSLIVLAPKPHQEHVDNIDDFVWRMCISYCKLNSVTLPFAYPIPRCDDAINDFGDGVGRLWFIGLDAHQGYHQIRVRPVDRVKLAFFAPDGKKYTFKVMPFGPTNTALMRQLQDEWDALFESLHPNSAHHGCHVIIDDILLFSSDILTLIQYLDCVCQVFIKYQVSLKLEKCDFLKERFEYVSHDITADGNCPAKSKFDLVHD
jgi:hypothetical protein